MRNVIETLRAVGDAVCIVCGIFVPVMIGAFIASIIG